MCDCIKAAISRGYVICPPTYDEAKHEFKDGELFYMPLAPKDEKGKFKYVKLTIEYCPICGEKLTN